MTRFHTSLKLIGIALAFALSVVSQAMALSVPAGLGGRDWESIPTTHKVLALTFDAGSNADGVSSILATLRRQRVPATFFLTGRFVEDFGSQARAIAAAGERIGDHSIAHLHFPKLSDAAMRHEVLGAKDQIVNVTGTDPWPWFRFPFGDVTAHTIAVVNSVGFVPIRWTVDTLGFEGTSSGMTAQKVVDRVLAGLRPGEIVLMHCGSHPKDHSTLDADALPTMIRQLRARGYSFVTLDAMRGIGYLVLTSNGGIHNYGAPFYGSDARKLPAGVSAVATAIDPVTGGYWILKSDGGVDKFNAPWFGSMRNKLPAGQKVTGIAASPRGGYLVLTSNGGVHNYGAPFYGSDARKLPAGVSAVAIAADPASGGYWILKSDGGVDKFHAPWFGSMRNKLPAGQRVTGIAASPRGGYLVLTSNGGVHDFGAPWFGSDANHLPAGVRAVGIAADPATAGYWILKSDGGVDKFNAPWYGSMRNKIPVGQTVVGIAGE